MLPDRILHPGLAKTVAELGHTDIIMVTDAGFPIPQQVNRIDLGFYQGLVDVRDILRVLRREMFAEEIRFAPEVKTHHPNLYREVQQIYKGSGATFVPAPHEELIEVWAPKAKAIIRSGSFEPWANFAITASTDPNAWFTSEEITVLPTYLKRRTDIEQSVVPEF